MTGLPSRPSTGHEGLQPAKSQLSLPTGIYLVGFNVRRQKKPAKMEEIRLLLSPTLGPRACDHATVAYRRGPLPVMKVTRGPATGEESVGFAHRNIHFGLQRETAEETSEDRRDTDRDEAGDIDVDCLL